MRFGSVCSGIESASVAWEPLGWNPAWFSEIEPFPCAVLAHRFPDVTNLGDMTKIADLIETGIVEAPDILVGGTPCQAFSVAGLRQGLADARGQLTLAYVELANAIDVSRKSDGAEPCIVVWENVPGVLTSKDNAFGCFLAGLAGESVPLQPAGRKWANTGVVLGPQRTIAWRILDAQYIGLAQRRARVFVIASAREGFDPVELLLEFDGVRRDSPPSRTTRQDLTGTIDSSFNSGDKLEISGGGFRNDQFVGLKAARMRGFGDYIFDETASTTKARDYKDATDLVVYENGLIPFDTTQITSPSNYSNPQNGGPCHPLAAAAHVPAIAFTQNSRSEVRVIGDDGQIAGCISANSGMNQTNYIAFSSKDYGADATDNLSPTLRAGGHLNSHPNAGVPPAIAYAIQERAVAENPLSGPDGIGVRADNCAYTMEARQSPQAVAYSIRTADTGANGIGIDDYLCPSLDLAQPPAVAYDWMVRRLMPVECERLQGFPDGWSNVPIGTKGKRAADGPRYKALGNSMASNVMNWIGKRIVKALRTAEFRKLVG